jgi:hypothetical protein
MGNDRCGVMAIVGRKRGSCLPVVYPTSGLQVLMINVPGPPWINQSPPLRIGHRRLRCVVDSRRGHPSGAEPFAEGGDLIDQVLEGRFTSGGSGLLPSSDVPPPAAVLSYPSPNWPWRKTGSSKPPRPAIWPTATAGKLSPLPASSAEARANLLALRDKPARHMHGERGFGDCDGPGLTIPEFEAQRCTRTGLQRRLWRGPAGSRGCRDQRT